MMLCLVVSSILMNGKEMYFNAGGVLLCEVMIGIAKFGMAGVVLLCLVRLGLFMQGNVNLKFKN